jgi:hypothetical protein
LHDDADGIEPKEEPGCLVPLCKSLQGVDQVVAEIPCESSYVNFTYQKSDADYDFLSAQPDLARSKRLSKFTLAEAQRAQRKVNRRYFIYKKTSHLCVLRASARNQGVKTPTHSSQLTAYSEY